MRRGRDVRRREAQLSPTRVAVLDVTAQDEGATEHRRRRRRGHRVERPAHRASNSTAARRRSAPRRRRSRIAVLRHSTARRRRAVVTETKVLADDDLPRVQLTGQDARDELRRRLTRRGSASNVRTRTCSMPSASNPSSRCSSVPRSRGARWGAKTCAGWGSKVTTSARRRCARSPSRCSNMSMTAWWPRCRPSKTPIAMTESPSESFDVSPSRTTIMCSKLSAASIHHEYRQYQLWLP